MSGSATLSGCMSVAIDLQAPNAYHAALGRATGTYVHHKRT